MRAGEFQACECEANVGFSGSPGYTQCFSDLLVGKATVNQDSGLRLAFRKSWKCHSEGECKPCGCAIASLLLGIGG